MLNSNTTIYCAAIITLSCNGSSPTDENTKISIKNTGTHSRSGMEHSMDKDGKFLNNLTRGENIIAIAIALNKAPNNALIVMPSKFMTSINHWGAGKYNVDNGINGSVVPM